MSDAFSFSKREAIPEKINFQRWHEFVRLCMGLEIESINHLKIFEY